MSCLTFCEISFSQRLSILKNLIIYLLCRKILRKSTTEPHLVCEIGHCIHILYKFYSKKIKI